MEPTPLPKKSSKFAKFPKEEEEKADQQMRQADTEGLLIPTQHRFSDRRQRK